MSKMLQIRNMPDDVHRALKARAALAGKSMSELVLDELTRLLAMPSELELRASLAASEPFELMQSSAALIRSDRDAA